MDIDGKREMGCAARRRGEHRGELVHGCGPRRRVGSDDTATIAAPFAYAVSAGGTGFDNPLAVVSVGSVNLNSSGGTLSVGGLTVMTALTLNNGTPAPNGKLKGGTFLTRPGALTLGVASAAQPWVRLPDARRGLAQGAAAFNDDRSGPAAASACETHQA